MSEQSKDLGSSSGAATESAASNDDAARKTSPFAPLTAGLMAGASSTALLLPLDTIKVRLQVLEKREMKRKPAAAVSSSVGATGAGSKLGPAGVKPSRASAYRIFRGIVQHEGVAGLYQGMVPAIIGSSVSWGGYFFLYEGFKSRLKQYKSASAQSASLSSLENFQLACSAGAVMVFITNPIWLIKLRLQLQMKQASQGLLTKEPYTGMVDAARTIVRDEGLFALYKGTGPALMLTSHGGVQFVVYEYLRKHFHYARSSRTSKEVHQPVMERLERSLGYLTMGATAKIVASTTTYPLQVLKARMQQRSEVVELTEEGGVRVAQREYAGVLKTIGRIWQAEGILGFFGGCIPNAIRVAPSAAITFVVYESVMDWLELRV